MPRIANWTDELQRAVSRLNEIALRDASSDDQEVLDAIRASGGILLLKDMGGCLLLSPTGEVFEWAWGIRSLVPVVSEDDHKLARVLAAERYPQLVGIRPPAGLHKCDACGGSGKVRGQFRCGKCLGLGSL